MKPIIPLIFFFFLNLVGSQKPPSVRSLSLIKEQISEVMIICEGRPTSCLCGDGNTLPGEFFFPGIFSCSPKSCSCPSGIPVNNLDSIEVEEDLTPEKFRRMMTLGAFMGVWSRIQARYASFCNDTAPSSCSCQDGGEIRSFSKKTNALITCRPTICQCADGSSKSVLDDMRHSFLSQMEFICDVKECPCSKGKVPSLTPPFTSLTAWEKCSPRNCSCVDGSSKELPELPFMEENLIQSIDDLGRKRLRSFSTLCDGSPPESCECIKRSEPLSSFGDESELRKCYPSSCKCPDGSVETAPKRRGSFRRIIRDMDLKYGKEETNKLIYFYRQRNYKKYIPSKE
eukprot:TRINITY_DN8626_c0_g1_i1.p1 TRINITY_DN8626_c0_g1~~TRINITY_DN8626_c0_g1_i1.p1  ORF type:complete len:342 (+),score=85.16 TRINITY_DN8626_c0_g1_i1:1-1026(+)